MQRIRIFTLAAAAAASLFALPALAAAPKVLASLTQPRGGLDCESAADEAKVVFDFQQPRSDVKQISVFVNGTGIPEKDVDQEWPTVTVLHGLEPGRNTVELVAKGKDGKNTSHKLVVLVGTRPKSGEKGVAVVDCSDRPQVASSEPEGYGPWGEVLQSEDSLEDEDDGYYDEADDEVVYEGPRYVYYPYPAFGYVAYEPVYYYPWPYYYSYYYYPYHRHSYRYGGYYGAYYGGYRHYHHREPGRAYRGAGWNNAPHRYTPTRPPTHSGGGWSDRGRDGPRSAPQSMSRGGGGAWRGRGDRR